MLRSALNRKLGQLGHARDAWIKSLSAALIAAGLAGSVYLLVGQSRLSISVLTIGLFGAVYLVITYAVALPEARQMLGRVARHFH